MGGAEEPDGALHRAATAPGAGTHHATTTGVTVALVTQVVFVTTLVITHLGQQRPHRVAR